ncbi:MAG: hypothetical protein ACP6IP_04025 [Candidatus Njordarchaeia archaeon]
MKYFNYIIALLSVLFLIVGIWNISVFYSNPTIKGYLASNYMFELEIAFVSYLIAVIVLSGLSYYIYGFLRLIRSEEKKVSIQGLFYGFLIIDIGFIFFELGLIWIFINNASNTFIDLGIIKLYPYPIGFLFATLFGFTTSIYLLIYGINEFYGGVSDKHYYIGIIMYLVGGALAIMPNNYYGVITPENVFDVRLYTDFLLFMYFLAVIILIVRKVFSKLGETTDPLSRFKLYMVGLGFLLIIGFFVFYIIDTITSGGRPYTVWMLPALLSLSLATILIYLGNVTPTWIAKRYR